VIPRADRTPVASKKEPLPAAPPPVDAAPVDTTIVAAVRSSCRLVYGPAEQPFRGTAALFVRARELLLVTNDHGKPRIFPIPIVAPSAARAPRAAAAAKPLSFVTASWPPCEIAEPFAYCTGDDGTVYRTTIGESDTKAVAKGRPGRRIAAASLGNGHAAVATLDTRRTAVGEVLTAFVTLDDRETRQLSEDGAGATAVRMLPRDHGAVAVYLDARSAMTPVHARTIALDAADLVLGSDRVLFVGGPSERGTDVTLARGAGSLYALVPLAQSMHEFGMATIEVHDPPIDDVPAVWSLYPNGLDPAPIGATTHTTQLSAQLSDRGGAWVSRVRPSGTSAQSRRVLELGRINESGAFTSMGVLADGDGVTDIAMTTDAFGSVWILYGNMSVAWLERRVCF